MYLGPKPWPPRNVSIEKGPLGVVITWQPPKNQTVPVAFYFVEHRTDDGQWQRWGPIRDETSYLGNFSPLLFIFYNVDYFLVIGFAKSQFIYCILFALNL